MKERASFKALGTEIWVSLPYYFFRLTPVALGMPGCLRAVAAVAIMIYKTSIVLASDYIAQVPHAVLNILIRYSAHVSCSSFRL